MTNRKRKLKYIREKNRLRLGGEHFVSFFMSNELTNKKYLENRISNIGDLMVKKYKMPLQVRMDMSINKDDFIRNIKTIRLTFKKQIT